MSFDSSSRRTVLKGIGAGTAALVGGAGVASASPGRGPPSEGETILDVAQKLAKGEEKPDFDALVEAVVKAGLTETLDGNRQLTVFAPTDKAFEEAGIKVSGTSEQVLRNVLTYHVIPGRRKAKSITTSNQLPTLNGAKIDVEGTDLNGDQADIVDTNIEASNGIIHAIDGVLMP